MNTFSLLAQEVELICCVRVSGFWDSIKHVVRIIHINDYHIWCGWAVGWFAFVAVACRIHLVNLIILWKWTQIAHEYTHFHAFDGPCAHDDIFVYLNRLLFIKVYNDRSDNRQFPSMVFPSYSYGPCIRSNIKIFHWVLFESFEKSFGFLRSKA